MLIAAVALGLVALTGAVVWTTAHRDGADPVSVEDAVTGFRDESDAESSRSSPIRPGVYVYATRGFERTDALTGVTHRYPAHSTITVTAAPCGARLHGRALAGRSTAWTYCTGGDGVVLHSQDERHTFFGRTERTTYECTSMPLLPGEPRRADIGTVRCAGGDTSERGVVRVVGMSTLRVGGTGVETVHVRKQTRLSGGSRGTSRHDLWLEAETGLPVRLVLESHTTSDSPVGDVRYDEEVALDLVSLEPRR